MMLYFFLKFSDFFFRNDFVSNLKLIVFGKLNTIKPEGYSVPSGFTKSQTTKLLI